MTLWPTFRFVLNLSQSRFAGCSHRCWNSELTSHHLRGTTDSNVSPTSARLDLRTASDASHSSAMLHRNGKLAATRVEQKSTERSSGKCCRDLSIWQQPSCNLFLLNSVCWCLRSSTLWMYYTRSAGPHAALRVPGDVLCQRAPHEQSPSPCRGLIQMW